MLILWLIFIMIQCWSCSYILDRMLWLHDWCRWLGLLRNRCRRWLRYLICRSLLLSHMYICIIIKRLKRSDLILPLCWLLSCCCGLLWFKLLGCRGPTPSRRRRLGSWLGHLCVKLIHAYDGWQAQALKALHDNGLPPV